MPFTSTTSLFAPSTANRALPETYGEITRISGNDLIFSRTSSFCVKVAEPEASMRTSGSYESRNPLMTSKKPLNTDKTTINKAVPMVIPVMLMKVSVEISDICFLEKRYRLAINPELLMNT